MWLTLSLTSALLLGCYDVFKKFSLRGNAVLPVLFTAAIFGALVFVPFLIIAEVNPNAIPLLHMPHMTWEQHALTLLKSTIVAASWVLSYYAMRYLPITIVSPIRATSPLLTLIGAVTLLGETLNPIQWLGVAITVLAFWLFSKTGKLENISFLRNKWIICLYGGTFLAAISGLYDKYLLGHLMIPKNTMQAWFSIYIPVVLLPFLLLKWWPARRENKFVFRWTIPLIGITLGFADFVYFYALAEPDSLVAIVSALRRCSVVVPFFVGALFLGEQHVWRKFLILCGMLAGVAMIVLSSG
ncbi:MAG: DMT family transporter [Prevotellaceae bacterium]|jgi:transporter family protein|nr:DMT family transporter [Prevotellaceae bacterium]